MIPFLGTEPNWFSHNHRLKVIREFIGQDIQGLRVLDIGGDNRLAKSLHITEHTWESDFNREIHADSDGYDIGSFASRETNHRHILLAADDHYGYSGRNL